VVLPSKKIFSFLLIVGGLVAAIIIAFGGDRAGVAVNKVGNIMAGEKISLPENQDWKSDLSRVGDTSVTPINTEKADVETGDETITDDVSRTFISNYLNLKQSGSLTPESSQNLVNSTATYIEKLGERKVDEAKLYVIPDEGKKTIIWYGEKLGSILKNNQPKSVKNELDILSEAVESRDPSKMQELDGIIAIYKNMEKELSAMAVPKTFVKAHTDITNGVRGMILGLEEMKMVFGDPFKGLFGMQMYQEGGNLFIEAFKATQLFFIQQNISYKQGSGGYYIIHGI
jgi:flagellar motor component MotA